MTEERTWSGDNPFYLVINDKIGNWVGIDLDAPGWTSDNSGLMRSSGNWFLVRKGSNQAVLQMTVIDGEQPYYTAHHVGRLGSGGSNEVVAHGIGKKQIDGSMIRLWLMPNGVVCGGDDVDTIGIAMVNLLGPR